MKRLLILLPAFIATVSFGQTTGNKTPGILLDSTKKTPGDTALRVIYADNNKLNQPPAFFINGRFVMSQTFASLNPQNIESVDVVKVDTLVDNVQYYGRIYIKTKQSYIPKLITLTELKNKYTDLKGKPAVFMIDGNFVNANYDNFVVDESNLLTIIVDKLQTGNEKIDLGLIKLLTKSEENIKKRNQIILRGTELSMNK